MFGVALLFFSASALGQARMAAGKINEIDAAAAIVTKSFGESAWEAIVKVLTIPSNGVAALGSAATSILLAPFRVAGEALFSIGEIGMGMIGFLRNFLSKIVSSPRLLKHSLMSLKGSATNLIYATMMYIYSLPGLALSHTKTGLITLGLNTGSATASAGRLVYASLALRIADFLGFCRSGLAAGAARSSASFVIISKQLSMQGRRQFINFNDAYDKFIARLASAISQLIGRSKQGDTGTL